VLGLGGFGSHKKSMLGGVSRSISLENFRTRKTWDQSIDISRMIGCQYDGRLLLDDGQKLFVRGRTYKKIYENKFLSLRRFLS